MDEFERYLKLERGLKDISIIFYKKAINLLSKSADLLSLVEYRQVADLIMRIKEERNLSDRYIYKIASIASIYYNWAAREGLIKDSPMRLGHGFKKKESTQIEFFDWDSEDFKKIIYNPNNSIRINTILHTLRSSGIRANELCSLYKKDVQDKWLRIREGKGGRERFAPIDDECRSWYSIYLPNLDRHYSGDHLFLTEDFSRPLNPHSLWKMLYRMGQRHGVRCYPHKFRHSLGGTLIEKGADVTLVRDVLGHKTLSSTNLYVHLKRKTVRDSYDSILKKSS